MSTDNVGPKVEESSLAASSSAWDGFIEPFAKAVGKSAAEVSQSLESLAGAPGEAAIAVLASEEFASFEDIAAALSELKIPKGILKKALTETIRKKAVVATPQSVAPTNSFDILPSIPDDKAWLAALKTGGSLKVEDPTIVISGMRAALASRSGLFELPARISEMMETHAESLDEPVKKEYFELHDMLIRRNYAEIFAALEIDGRTHASPKRKNALVMKLDQVLWPSLIGFQGQLKSWAESWQQAYANPGATMGLLAAAMGGQASFMPPGMTAAPATDSLHDAAAGVIDQINHCFAGLRIPAAMAMAYDALQIKTVLDNPALPGYVGAANREQMIKLLGVAVTPDYVRLEQNLARYTLAVMEFPNKTGDAEIPYLSSLLMLGSQIPWDKLGVPARRSTLPSARPRTLDEDDSSDEGPESGSLRPRTRR